MTPDGIRVDVWAHYYAEHPDAGIEVVDDDFDDTLREIREANGEDWEDVT